MSNLTIRTHEAKQTESLSNVEYRIVNAHVDVYVDDPEQGETDFYKDYAVDSLINSNDHYASLNDLLRAVANQIGDSAYADPAYWLADRYKDSDGILKLQTDVTVDSHDIPADDSDLQAWKQGKRRLYNAHWLLDVRCRISTPIPVDDMRKELAAFQVDF